MTLKKSLIRWYVQNIIIPNNEVFDIPGFILNKVSKSTIRISLREILIPEKLIQNIEKRIVKKYSLEGKKRLYSAGKKFGYFYSSISSFPKKNQISKNQFIDFADFIIYYISGIYADDVTYQINYLESVLEISFDNYIVCRNNGQGYLMKQGAISGVWSYVVDDKTSESIQVSCQGRGQDRCKIVCGPLGKIPVVIDLIQETDLIVSKITDDYLYYNSPKKSQYSSSSVSDWKKIGKVTQINGELLVDQFRYFTTDIHLLPFIEQEVLKLKDGKKELFNLSFDFGKELMANSQEKNIQYLSDFFSTIGYGDLLVSTKNSKVIATFYNPPYYLIHFKSDLIILRGLLSGMISSIKGNKVVLKNLNIDQNESYAVLISE